MTARSQIMWWGGTAVAFILLLWLLKGILGPFLFGMAIAYFADPLADRLEERGLSRIAATVIVMGSSVMLGILALLVIVPMLLEQAQQLMVRVPDYVERLRSFTEPLIAQYAPGLVAEDSATLEQLRTTMKNFSVNALKGVLSGGLAIIDLVAVMVVTPVVAFYLLLDWDRMVAIINDLLPRQHAATIRDLSGRINRVLSAFVRGQLLVCVLLGSFYAVALTIIGLDFGLVIGLLAGLLSFIPYIGAIIGALLSVGVAIAQFWGEWWMVGAVAAVFFVGQAVEGNILTPNLVGGSVGLHPVWLLFALSAFGSVFGFVGMLIAVPAAAAIGVLARWGIERYRESRLYQGADGA